MNIRIVISLIFILFLEFSYTNNIPESCEANKQHTCKNPLPVQNFEVRAFTIDIKQTQLTLSLLNATFKGEYEFRDYIYYPQDREFDLNKEFIRLRVYQKTQWDQKSVELSHKIKGDPGVSGSLKLKKQFNTLEEANTCLSNYRLAFLYQRKGFEYQLDDVKIFLEDIQNLPPSIELVSPSKSAIDQLFDKLAPVQILSDSVPKLIQNTIRNKSKQNPEYNLNLSDKEPQLSQIAFLETQDLYKWVQDWIDAELDSLTLGVLATVDNMGSPHSRTVAIREFDQKGPLFFTQKGSKKVSQMNDNNQVSLTILLFEKKRQITIKGAVEPLLEEENYHYWQNYPKTSQIRFLVYGPKSGEFIDNNCSLDAELYEIEEKYKHIGLEKPEAYVGYRIIPQVVELYQFNKTRISDSFVATKQNDSWSLHRVVP